MVSLCGLCRPKAAPKPDAELSDDRHPQPVVLNGDKSRDETKNKTPPDSTGSKSGETSSPAKNEDVAIEIWGGAYSESEEEAADLVKVYETILSQQLLECMPANLQLRKESRDANSHSSTGEDPNDCREHFRW